MRAQAIRAVLLAIAIAACLADMRPSSFVDLEHLLCKVEPDGGNSCHGRPSLVIRLQRSLYGTLMPCEAPSTSSKVLVLYRVNTGTYEAGGNGDQGA